MKKCKKRIGILFLGVWLFCGCAAVEPENRVFPQIMGVDYQNDQFQVIYGIPKMSTVTGQGKSAENAGEDTQIRMYEGETLEAARERFDLSQEKYLDLGHVKVLVLGENIWNKKEKMYILLDYLQENPALAGNIYVFQTSQMTELMSLNGGEIDSLGDYLTGMIENKPQSEVKKPAQLKDLYNAWYNGEEFPSLRQAGVKDRVIYLE